MEKMPLTLDPNFVKTASKHLKRRRQRLLFLGSKGFGRRSFIEQWAHGEKMPTIEVDWNAISSDETPEHLLQIVGLWFREARLIHAILVFRCDETPSFEIESLLQRIAPKFKQIADHHPGTICLIAQTRLEFFLLYLVHVRKSIARFRRALSNFDCGRLRLRLMSKRRSATPLPIMWR